MKYLKTNEGLFTGKVERLFSGIIEKLEKRFVDRGWNFKKEPNKLFMGVSNKDIINSVDYTITKDSDDIVIKYLMKIILVKEKTFSKPYLDVRVTGYEMVDGGDKQSDNSDTVTFNESDLSNEDKVASSIYGLLDRCKQRISQGNSVKKTIDSFYDDFPIEDIKDRLLDLQDEFGVSYEIYKVGAGLNPYYEVDMDLGIKFKTMESFGSHYIEVDEKMDMYAKVIMELNNLSKVFKSMGLTMWFEPYYLINIGGVSFRLYKTIKE
jgi:hypothetical protein